MSIELQWLILHNLSNTSDDIVRKFFTEEKSQIINLWQRINLFQMIIV